jgi:hypothetical protein
MTMAVLAAWLKTRHMLTTKTKALKQFYIWASSLVIPKRVRRSLLVARPIPLMERVEFFVVISTMEIFTDASDSGWGIVEGHNSWSGQWTSE